VQEHTEHNLKYSARGKAFMIPHGVDVQRFQPGLSRDFRSRHGIPADAFVVISVGTVCYHHKRMDYVIREVARVPDAYLIIVGEENRDTPSIKNLGQQLMGGRILFTRLPHEELPRAYAAADVFVLGSLFETFGIVYIEALAMGLSVICTNHVNQRSIVKEGIFIDMRRPGELAAVLRDTPRTALAELGERGRAIAERYYDLRVLKHQYLERYQAIAAAPSSLPKYTLKTKLSANAKSLVHWSAGLIRGRAE
jgi:glycosyltransferase involved in cell wall biosynthesis